MRAPTAAPLRGLLVLLFLAAFGATARAVVPSSDGAALDITGRVTEAGSGRPLEGAQVSLPGLAVGTLTDARGRYALAVPEDHLHRVELTVSVQLIGFGAATAIVRTADAVDGRLVADFTLESRALRLQELVVTGVVGDAVRADAGAPPPALPARAAQEAMRVRPQPLASALADPQGWDREQYGHIEENGFHAVADAPLSTFSVDVDRASYGNLRRFLLREHRLPPVDAVQIEEMVNYFAYDYTLPRGDAPVAVTTELGEAPWRPEHRLLRVGLAARPIEVDRLPPSNLVFLLDVSGSMSAPDKLPLVKSSLRLLVDQMRPEDHVSIVVYAGAAGLVLEPTSGSHKDRIIAAIEGLESGGSTAGGAGLRLAYDVARRHFRGEGNNRVILATDGDFNVGESSDGAMVRLIEERRSEGTFLTVLGFGTGNLQNEKMQSIAQHGNGNYAYIDGLDEARKVLVGEMGGTLVAVAQDVKIQVEFNPAAVQAYRLLGYENRLLADEDFNDDRKDAGEMGAGHTVTALYEIVPAGLDSFLGTPGVDPLRYQTPAAPAATESHELAFVRVRYKEPRGTESRLLERPVADALSAPSHDFTFAAAVAGFGMLLRDSEHRGLVSTAQVLELAGSSLGEDVGGYRAGFLELVRAYDRLSAGTDGDGEG